MFAHHWVSSRLDAFVDGELATGDQARVAIHIQDCWMCSGKVQSARGIRISLRNLGRSRPVELAQVRLKVWASESLS